MLQSHYSGASYTIACERTRKSNVGSFCMHLLDTGTTYTHSHSHSPTHTHTQPLREVDEKKMLLRLVESLRFPSPRSPRTIRRLISRHFRACNITSGQQDRRCTRHLRPK